MVRIVYEIIAVCKGSHVVYACGFDRNANANENDSTNQNDVAKMTLQK